MTIICAAYDEGSGQAAVAADTQVSTGTDLIVQGAKDVKIAELLHGAGYVAHGGEALSGRLFCRLFEKGLTRENISDEDFLLRHTARVHKAMLSDYQLGMSEKSPEVNGLMITKKGIWYLYLDKDTAIWDYSSGRYRAAGCARKVAEGAMYQYAKTIEPFGVEAVVRVGVEAAIAHSGECGGDVVVRSIS